MHANTQWRTHSVYPCCLGLPESSLYYLPPLPQTAVCTYECCVVVGGVVCAVEGYNLVVNKRWKNRWFRARCSPTAGKPVPCSWGQQSTEDLRWNPVVLCHSQTSPKHCLPEYPRTPENSSVEPEWICCFLFCHLGSPTIYEPTIHPKSC